LEGSEASPADPLFYRLTAHTLVSSAFDPKPTHTLCVMLSITHAIPLRLNKCITNINTAININKYNIALKA
jgi:hypothetical protein